MDKTEKIWLNGKLVDWEDAKVHVLAHALNYGTGVFEGIRVYHTPKGMAIFRLKDHVQRMMDGCKIMGIDLEFEGKTYGFDDICNAIKDVVRANGEAVDYVKPCIFLSGEEVGLNPIGVPASMAITCIHMGNYLGTGADAGAKLITSSWQRPDNLCGPAGAKVNGSYVASTLAKREAVRQGANEAVMLNSVGHVAECTGENIFMYHHGQIITPAPAEARPRRSPPSPVSTASPSATERSERSPRASMPSSTTSSQARTPSTRPGWTTSTETKALRGLFSI